MLLPPCRPRVPGTEARNSQQVRGWGGQVGASEREGGTQSHPSQRKRRDRRPQRGAALTPDNFRALATAPSFKNSVRCLFFITFISTCLQYTIVILAVGSRCTYTTHLYPFQLPHLLTFRTLKSTGKENPKSEVTVSAASSVPKGDSSDRAELSGQSWTWGMWGS